jgi:hypothetical protein
MPSNALNALLGMRVDVGCLSKHVDAMFGRRQALHIQPKSEGRYN